MQNGSSSLISKGTKQDIESFQFHKRQNLVTQFTEKKYT